MKVRLDIETLGEEGYHAFCKVRVNGHVCRALIDTGASKTVVGTALVNTLGLQPFSHPLDNQMTGIQPGDVEITFVTLSEVRFKKIIFPDLLAGTVNLDHVVSQYEKLGLEPIQLIIGGDILYAGRARIDYGKKSMKLHSP